MLKVTKVTGQGWVTGITVPDGIIRVRRNGKEFWTGNSGRAETGAMTQEDQPAKGSEGQAKRVGGLDVSALLSHSATEVLRDAMAIRGTRNEDYWNALKLGRPLPQPGVPFIYEKFVNLLKAGGLNVTRRDDKQILSTLTDDDIVKLSRGPLENADTVESSTLEPIKGGLFDEAKTGGSVGKAWSHIDLPEPLPNPAMEEPIRRLLGLTQKEFRDVLARRGQLPGGGTGGEAMKTALASLNMDDLIEKYRDEAMNSRGAKRDNAVKCLRYLVNSRKQGIAPDRWMLTKVPVIPPVFRPISRMGDVLLVSDMNDLYRDVFETVRQINESEHQVEDNVLADDRERLYDSVSGVFGWGDPASVEHQTKGLKGAVRQVFGSNPKCYDDATEILTRSGWVPFPDYSGDCDVATINPETGLFEWQRPTDTIHKQYIGIMVHTKTRKLDLVVTPNHEHWVQERKGGGWQGLDAAGEAQWTSPVKLQAGTLVGRTKRVRYYTAASGWAGTTPTYVFSGVTVPAAAFASFVGYYVSEGWLDADRYGVHICQKTDTEHCADITAVIAALGLPYTVHDYDKGPRRDGYAPNEPQRQTYWRIASPELARWLETNIGHGAANKYISPEVLAWAVPELRNLLAAYMHGDGERHCVSKDPAANKTHYNRDPITTYGNRAVTVSRKLVDTIAELCMKIGLGFALRDTTNFEGHPNWQTQYRFRIHGWNKVIVEYPEQTQWLDYNGFVHCVTVPNGLVIVRRNGCTAVSGNSGLAHSKLFSKTVDMVSRGVVTPNPDFDMDTLGIPEDKAWDMYRPFVMRRLVKRGFPPVKAAELIEQRHKEAEQELDAELRARPVLMNRAPTWHKFNILAFNPVKVNGKTLQVSPLIVSGFNMDFNGDSCEDTDILCEVDGTFFYGKISELVAKYMVAGYNEDSAVKLFGTSTAVFNFQEGRVRMIGLNKNGASGLMPLDGMSIHTSHGPICYRVGTASGVSAVFTAHHSFATLDSSTMELKEIRTSELSVGQLLPCAREFHLPETVLEAPGAPTRCELNYNTGFWFGHYFGDGSLTGRSDTISQASTDPQLLSYLAAIGDAFIGRASWKEGNGFSVRWTDVPWYNYLASFGMRCDGKLLPGWMFAAPMEFKRGLIAGMYVAEGSADKCGGYRFEIVNRRLLVQFKTLIESLGGICRLSDGKKAEGNHRASYILRTNINSFDSAGITFPEVLKISKKFTEERKSTRDNWDLVPFPHCIGDACRTLSQQVKSRRIKEARLTGKGCRRPLDSKAFNQALRRGWCTRVFARKVCAAYCVDACDSLVVRNWLDIVNNTTVYWTPIESMTQVERPDVTYDFSLPDMHLFAVEGTTLVHNSANFHVPVSDEAVKEAREKMLPSANIFKLTDLRTPQHAVGKEMLLGLYQMTRPPKNQKPIRFDTTEQAREAYNNGLIDMNTPIIISKE